MMALIDLIKEQGQMLKKQGDMLVKMQEGKTSPPESSAGVKSYYDSFLSTAQLVGITKDYSITSLLFLLLRK
jgi:hypothetical protein